MISWDQNTVKVPDIQHEFFEQKLQSISKGLSTRINELM